VLQGKGATKVSGRITWVVASMAEVHKLERDALFKKLRGKPENKVRVCNEQKLVYVSGQSVVSLIKAKLVAVKLVLP
jgi:hypothetical protein